LIGFVGVFKLQAQDCATNLSIYSEFVKVKNFAALHSLVTSGIQKGHMKMHLLNILNQLGATETEKVELVAYYKDQTATHSHVVSSFKTLRKNGSL
ncbi:hypothetical protein N9244_04155, partial [Flavobacteriaceae bacterium]|nr:hypothetical protein [Flavobacteriaceae bacterium]